MNEIDFQKIFLVTPANILLLKPDAPKFTILAVNEGYLEATNTVREKIVGRGLFEVFPDNPDDPHATGVRNLTRSLLSAIKTKQMDKMATQKYDIPTQGDKFEVRYWDPDNTPVLGDDGEVLYLIHHVTDVTNRVELVEQLKVKIEELETLNKAMIGRELKMAALKDKLAQYESDRSS